MTSNNSNYNDNYEQSILNLLNEDKENINYSNINFLALNNNNSKIVSLQHLSTENISLSNEKNNI